MKSAMLSRSKVEELKVNLNNKLKSDALIIGIVAGEASGDSLGADFMQQMNAIHENIQWVGVGGAKMQAQGLSSLFDLSRLSVMGLVEVIKHLSDLFKARDELINAFTNITPKDNRAHNSANFSNKQIDMFIGIDAPDFNLRVAKKLKAKSIYTVQYVSPSVWAWRESRIHGIKKATDLVLCLFPFELAVYDKHQHPAVCVGHSLLHTINPLLYQASKLEMRSQLYSQRFNDHSNLMGDVQTDILKSQKSSLQSLKQASLEIGAMSPLICIMPGSRHSEINAILPLMIQSMIQLLMSDGELQFIIPTVEQSHQVLVQSMINEQSDSLRQAVSVIYNINQPDLSQKAIAASQIVVLASGTATLEAMLLKTPMVVVYQLNNLTYQIASRLIKVPYVALPNILVGHEIVPELIQKNATANNVSKTVLELLTTDKYQKQIDELGQATYDLRQQTNQSPADVVLEYWLTS